MELVWNWFGAGLKLVFYQIELNEKNQCIISFHCVLVLISFVMFMIGIVKQEYIWYFQIISIENNINLSWSVSITVVS